jgi:hypothetical protein
LRIESVERSLGFPLLAPDIMKAILEGRTSHALMLERLERQMPMLPPQWCLDHGSASCFSEA